MLKQKLYEKQALLQNLKNPKAPQNKEKVDKETDYQFQLTQRDALIKQLKKENALQKTQIAKQKSK